LLSLVRLLAVMCLLKSHVNRNQLLLFFSCSRFACSFSISLRPSNFIMLEKKVGALYVCVCSVGGALIPAHFGIHAGYTHAVLCCLVIVCMSFGAQCAFCFVIVSLCYNRRSFKFIFKYVNAAIRAQPFGIGQRYFLLNLLLGYKRDP
jgi:fucose permease